MTPHGPNCGPGCKTYTSVLTTDMHHDVPEQDLCVGLARLPAIPRGCLVITNVGPTT